MYNQPLLSILINNYNYARFIRQAIDSALNQTSGRVEVIVVDDGSKDDSQEIIASYGNQITAVFKENGGQASAFNAGFQASRGEIVLFLDADDYFSADKVSVITQLFSENPVIGWIFHELEDVDAKGKSLAVENVHRLSELAYVDFRQSILNGDNLPFLPATSGLCFKRSVLAQILPMPEEILISADNFLRLAAIYLSPGLLLPDQLAVHRIHGSNLFEFRPDTDVINAETNIKTSYYLKDKFPQTKNFANRLYAHSLGKLAGKTSWRRVFQIPESKKYFHKFSLETWLSCSPRIMYNYAKSVMG
ncbi:glycosyltransferase family 2 protein [Fortiea contorta]|uniref:glycosyltransferase family 2 protein n=1 Tax=Fortiea contorta TaxID=1892405 RepID=UPI000345A953|nr:glycosyltransferase [Fortiea contorta]